VAITAYNSTRLGNLTTVEVTNDLSGTVYFHWYLDGCYQGQTTAASWTFYLPTGDQARVECLDTTDADFDPVAGAPDAYPPRRTLWWVRSQAADVDHYRVEQKKDAGDWSTIARALPEPTQWAFTLLTGRLDDLATYQWRVVPVDRAGNDGTPITLDAHKVVRTPDAPDFSISYNSGTTKVTFSAAS